MNKLTVCSHLNSSQSLRQSEGASQHVDKAAWLFTHSPDTVFPDVQRHFIIISVSVSKELLATPRHCVCVSGLTRSWNMYRLLVAAMAMMFSDGCQAMCRIFLVKSRLSTPTSPRRRLPPVYTRRVRSTARGLLLSRQASRVTPRPVSLSNIRKKLLYAPVMMTLRNEEMCYI